MRYRHAVLLTLSLIAAPSLRAQEIPLLAENLESITAGPVQVLHASGDSALAGRLAERAAVHHERIRRRLGLETRVGVALLLHSPALPEATFEKIEQSLAPWIAGAAYSGRQLIVLRIRPGQDPDEQEVTLAHELVHIILKSDYPNIGAWPLWFQEGIAMVESRGEGLRNMTALSIAALRRRLIPLDDIWSRFPENEAGARLAYAQSFSVTTYIIRRSGRERFRDFMSALRDEDFESAYRRVYGHGLGALENGWRRYVKRRYTWVPLATGGTAFWTMSTLLFFLALYLRRRKDRLIRESWEEEESA